ncbi:MAG: hypothetical protein MRY83_17815 [Flavobacteriales bacterium]|nr:hypothetical protein [Flavobacteriales bacterium]
MNKFLISLVISTAFFAVKAQETANPAGHNISNKNGSKSFSVVQIDYKFYSNSGSILEGVQQPYEINVVTGEELEEISLSWKSYPNPTSKRLFLESASACDDCTYVINNEIGQTILSSIISAKTSIIELNNIDAQVLYLSIYRKQNLMKTFKIVKL